MISISIDDVKMRVEVLGGFAIIADGRRIMDQDKRSTKIWKLLQYMVVNKHRMVSHEELTDVFFNSDTVDNPGSSVRTMIYRARTSLAESGFMYADDMILSIGGGYAWNNAVECSVDAAEFEDLCKDASSVANPNKRLELLLQATSLYKGDFLPNSSGELWVIPLARWYRSMYFNCVHDALRLLTEAGRSKEMEELCVKSLRIDPFDEVVLEYHLRSLLEQGKQHEALYEYKRMESMFFDELGVEFSDNLRTLYARITQHDSRESMSLEDLLKEWLDDTASPGPFRCDLSVFKNLYRIEARSVSRSGRTTYIVKIDVKHEPKSRDGGVMARLDSAISSSLRKSDLYTRSAPGQFLLMLNKLTYENCKMLIDRIMRSLDSKYLAKVIGTSVKPITPVV